MRRASSSRYAAARTWEEQACDDVPCRSAMGRWSNNRIFRGSDVFLHCGFHISQQRLEIEFTCHSQMPFKNSASTYVGLVALEAREEILMRQKHELKTFSDGVREAWKNVSFSQSEWT